MPEFRYVFEPFEKAQGAWSTCCERTRADERPLAVHVIVPSPTAGLHLRDNRAARPRERQFMVFHASRLLGAPRPGRKGMRPSEALSSLPQYERGTRDQDSSNSSWTIHPFHSSHAQRSATSAMPLHPLLQLIEGRW